MKREMTGRERLRNVMEYKPVDRLPNHEVGVWPQTVQRWEQEGMAPQAHSWDWFRGDPAFHMDRREYARVNYQMIPAFDVEHIEVTDEYEVTRHASGIVTKALREGTVGGGRMCMDQYLSFPVTDVASFREMKRRYNPTEPRRHVQNWKETLLPEWKARNYVLVLGENCQTRGFYWRARDWMGTENLSYALCLDPPLMHEMMEFIADFTIEVSRPYVEELAFDYIFINEDMAMKSGSLIGPAHYKEYIFPHMKRLVEFYKSHGTPYVVVDSDGDTDPLIPLLMDAGVDAIWPMERASEDMDPIELRKKYGKTLRLWGGVDKRELSRDKKAIDRHLRSLMPLVEDGGFIPTVDHTVPPDISYGNFCYYMERKMALLQGKI